MPISGIKYIGVDYSSPDGYADLNDAFIAIGASLVDDLDLRVASNVVNPPKATLSGVNFSGHNLRITFLTEHEGIARNPFQYIMDTAANEAMEFNNCINGGLLIEKANIRHITAAATSVSNRTIAFTGTTNLTVSINDTILQGGRKGQTALYVGSPIDLDAYNLTLSRYKNPTVVDEGRGIEITAGGTFRFENTTIHDCGTALTAPSSQAIYIANTYFADNDTDFTPTGGSSNVITSKNNGRSGSGLFGFLVETDTQDNLLSSAEFFSTDFESFDYLRLRSRTSFNFAGLTTADVSISDTVFNASITALNRVKVGDQLRINNSADTTVNDIGTVVDVDTVAGTIETNKATVSAFTAGAHLMIVTPIKGRAAESGLAPGLLVVPGNNHGIRLNNRGLNGTTSIGSDEAIRYTKAKIRNVPPQAGGNATAGNKMGESLTKQIPDRGENFAETRFLILDHGRDSDIDPTPRDPEWVDMTEFAGLYRLQKVPDVINVGTEGIRPYRFKASSLTLKMINTDFAWDNLKKIDLVTVEGNPAKFKLTENETNLDLKFRPVKFVAKFPKENMTVSYELGHFRINSINTDSSGAASLKLDSLEKDFIEKDADTVKDGKNWYFDRSVKFLVEELIKEVRSEYKDNKEVVVGQDTISLSGIETTDNQRVYSEFGRPIVTVKPNASELTKGEKRLVVTAAAPRCIFRGTLNNDISVGSNFIQMKFDDAIDIKKGDVLTVGNATGTDFSDMNEEKVVVLEDVSFSGTVDEVLNIRISSLKKNHFANEIVERWIIYLGCSNGIESPDESYLIAFDPDRDEYATMLDDTNSGNTQGYFPYAVRFLNLRQNLRTNQVPGPDEDGQPSGFGQRLMACAVAYSFPGKPNEPGKIYFWQIDTTKRWDEIHLSLSATVGDASQYSGGMYTGQMNFRSMKPMLTEANIGAVDQTDDSPAFHGAHAVGKFVEEVLFTNGVRLFGFGYIAGLAQDLTSGQTNLVVAAPANGTEIWGVQPVAKNGGTTFFSGTVYVIGVTEEETGYKEGIGETFYSDTLFFSARITQFEFAGANLVRYHFDETVPGTFSRQSSVVIVIPDSGKMYVGNCGENTVINEAQDLNVAEWLGDDIEPESKALDAEQNDTIYHDKIVHEKKDAIDRAKQSFKIEKGKIDAKAVDPGYYGSIVQKRKLEVDRGDVISENGEESVNFRIVPGQYTAQPFANELYKVYYPESPLELDSEGRSKVKAAGDMNSQAIIGDQPPIVFDANNAAGVDINGNTESITHPFMHSMFNKFFDNTKQTFQRNRNAHVWCFPIIGLWEKFDSINKSLLGFDNTVLADHGNAEMLGYWYLSYRNPHIVPLSDGNDVPRIETAYTDADGIVHVKRPDQITGEHFPLCTVLHNITSHNGGPGTVSLDFYGVLDDVMRARLEYIVGGSFNVFSSFKNGTPLKYTPVVQRAADSEYSYRYMRWDPAGSQFTNQYPLNMSSVPGGKGFSAKIVLKFKKIRDPQAKGTLFVGAHCYPVRPRHLHLPYGEEAFEDGTDIDIVSDGRREDVKPDSNRVFSYPAKVVDANFQLGSEELLNQNPDDNTFNFWTLDRYSQNKSIGMFCGAADDYDASGLLKGASLNNLNIEIPLGYKGKPSDSQPDDLRIQFTKNDTPVPFGVSTIGTLPTDNPFPDGFTPTLGGKLTINFDDYDHGFKLQDVGCIVKIDGFVKSFPAEYDDFLVGLLDGLYKVTFVAQSAPYSIELQGLRLNDTTFLTNYTGDDLKGFLGYTSNTCYIKRYYGDDLVYSDTNVANEIEAEEGSSILREYFGNRYAINIGDTFSYDVNAGVLTYTGPVAPNKLEFIWNQSGTNPTKINYSIWELTKLAGSAPFKLVSNLRESTGSIIQIPRFERRDIDHRDHLINQPSPSSAYPLPLSTTFLSYYKILFNCQPTHNDTVNYPAVLYGRSWGKFWKYYERRSTEKTKLVTRKTPYALIAPKDNFGETGLNSNAPLRIYLRNSITNDELEIYDAVSAPDPGPNLQYSDVGDRWNQWIREAVPIWNNRYSEFSLAVGPGIGGKYDGLYLFQNGPDFGEADLTLQVKSISKVPSTEYADLFFVNYPSPLDDYVDGDDVFFMYNNLEGDNSLTYLQVITVNTISIRARMWSDFTPGIGLGGQDPGWKNEDNEATLITRIGKKGGTSADDIPYSVSLRATSVNSGGFHQNQYGSMVIKQALGSGLGTIISLQEGKNYGAGDGVFDAGIKPLEFGDTFINSMAKWYLSRYDFYPKILANTYTINHDGPYLGDDARLYAIVYHHKDMPNVDRFPFLKFALGAQSNFRAALSATTNELYFARAKFVDVGKELQIQYWLAKYTEAAGIENKEIFPASGFISIQGTESQIKSDWEIHGIFKNENTGGLSCGIMRWVNRGNANKEFLTSLPYFFLTQAAYFSENLLAYSADDGTNWSFDRWQNEQPFGFSIQHAAQDISNYVEAIIVDPTHKTYTAPIWTLPLEIYVNGSNQIYTTNNPPNPGEFTWAWNGKNWNIVIGTGAAGLTAVTYGYANPTVIVSNNDFRSRRFGAEGFHSWLHFIKGWTNDQVSKAMTTVNPAVFKNTLWGTVMKRHELNDEDKTKREKREDLLRFHVEQSIVGPYSGISYFESGTTTMFPYALGAIKEFNDFRVSGQNGFYFTNAFDNELKVWNGEPTTSSVITNMLTNVPVVEGDFGQYYPMVKIGNSYEEVFGFSMGSKAHASTQSFRGGRNIIWKLSKSLSFHIAVADFEGLNVWDALGNFAELTDCVVGFDRFGNLHFEPRPIVDENTSFFFTFDNINEQNLISIKKQSAYQHVYNEIEIVPYRPELPAIQSNLISQSDLNVASVNNDVFIKDQSLDFKENAPDKARPEIKAFQRDFKRKRILLICTNGEFSSYESESKGLFSRFKYQMIEDLIELRLAADLESGSGGLYLNRLPFDSQTDSVAFESGDKFFIGADEYTVQTIVPETTSMSFTPVVPAGKRYEAGTPVVISSSGQESKQFFAEGSGAFSFIDGGAVPPTATGFTYSPKSWFVEIGEWSFDDNPNMKRSTILTSNIGPASVIIPVSSTIGFPNEGLISIAGVKIAYKGISSTAFLVDGPIKFDISAGLKVHLMPESPLHGSAQNLNYSPDPWLYGGTDELGASCLNEYHLFDPNEDGQPYFDGDPAAGGKPITALDFYSKNQRTISYYDSVNAKNANIPTIMSNNYGIGQDYRARHRTHVAMKIAFNGFRFSDGDKIELDVPGIKLAPQQHLTKVFSNYDSIKRNGLRQYPKTSNRFFNNSSATFVGKRILNRVSLIDEEIEVVGYISDINDLNWLSTIRIIDNRMFGSYPNNQAIGYVKSLKFNQNNGTVTITAVTQQT